MCEEQSAREYEYMDEDAIQVDLKCSICLQPLWDPVTIQPCTHTFCRSGIMKVVESTGKCPLCNGTIKLYGWNNAAINLVNILNAIPVKCNYCYQTNIERGNFNDHIQKKCSNYPVHCLNIYASFNCNWVGPRYQYPNHCLECNVEVIKYVDSLRTDIMKYIAQLESNRKGILLQHEHLRTANKLQSELKSLELRTNAINIEEEDLRSKLLDLESQLNEMQSRIPKDFKLQPQHLTYVHPYASWAANGIIVAGSHLKGSGSDTLSNPYGIYVDYDQTVYVADYSNNRIMRWRVGARRGDIAAGGNGAGHRCDQLNGPTDVIITSDRTSLIICDYKNRRVVQWPLVNGYSGRTIIENIDAHGLAMDTDGFLYVADYTCHEIKRYRLGESQGLVVAGGNGKGSRLDQFNGPIYVFVDQDRSLYVTDDNNHRIMKWTEGSKTGTIVAGGSGPGVHLGQLSSPAKVVVDQSGAIYIADWENDRVVRWQKGSKEGKVIIGGYSIYALENQLKRPNGLFLDPNGNIYVSGHYSHQVLKFNIK